MYNQFTSTFDDELSQLIETTEENTSDNLILDLRYNQVDQ